MSALSERLADVDDRLAKALARARRQTRHHGVRGDAVAAALGEEVRRHLIACASFEKGCEVRDTWNRLSREVDLVFLNRFHPAFLHDDSPKLVYIEGVLAAAEVKTSLNRAALLNATGSHLGPEPGQPNRNKRIGGAARTQRTNLESGVTWGPERLS